MTGTDVTGLSAADLGRVHFIGVGGVGMSGIARILLARGVPVSGSDAREWPLLDSLRALGAEIHIGHATGNVEKADTVVFSSAIKPGNPELDEARRRGLRVLHRSEALAAVMGGHRVLAISGTNGKTTTTSMLTTALQACGEDPSFAIGGELSEAGSNAHHGTGEYFVAEADESDRSFLLYRPYVAIVTNVEADHLDTYGTLAAIEDAFAEFASHVEPGGFLVACADDAGAARLARRARAAGVTVHTYGESDDADLRLAGLESGAVGASYTAVLDGVELGRVELPVPGRHIALNSAAALLTAARLGLSTDAARGALAVYGGVRRRFELKGTAAGIRVYDDYAYHPTSMTAQLSTVRDVAAPGRVIVAFQPYRFSRTTAFLPGIAAALGLADDVVVMEVYGPGEERAPGEGGVALHAAVPLPAGRKVFVPSWSEVAAEVARRAAPGDVVITMGAPPIAMLGEEILVALEETASGAAAGPEPAR
ncbi:MAG TPA: UDP-N-acetylmuramate--L-alanine ligase [Mycobacteriales bacterium]